MTDHVLVVDDNRDVANTMAGVIEGLGYVSKAVYSGEDGIREVSSFLPDMVLVDIGMPGIDGYETVTRMRQKRPAAEIIVVAVTGLPHDEHKQRAYDSGFDLFVSKPIGTRQLTDLLALLDPATAVFPTEREGTSFTNARAYY